MGMSPDHRSSTRDTGTKDSSLHDSITKAPLESLFSAVKQQILQHKASTYSSGRAKHSISQWAFLHGARRAVPPAPQLNKKQCRPSTPARPRVTNGCWGVSGGDRPVTDGSRRAIRAVPKDGPHPPQKNLRAFGIALGARDAVASFPDFTDITSISNGGVQRRPGGGGVRAHFPNPFLHSSKRTPWPKPKTGPRPRIQRVMGSIPTPGTREGYRPPGSNPRWLGSCRCVCCGTAMPCGCPPVAGAMQKRMFFFALRQPAFWGEDMTRLSFQPLGGGSL